MSGGAFDYGQYHISTIADIIEQEIINNGRVKTEEELENESWRDPEWYTKYPEDLKHYEYPEAVIEEFKNAVLALRIAHVYVQRVDWLLSGDDGETAFLKRLKDDLGNIKQL